MAMLICACAAPPMFLLFGPLVQIDTHRGQPGLRPGSTPRPLERAAQLRAGLLHLSERVLAADPTAVAQGPPEWGRESTTAPTDPVERESLHLYGMGFRPSFKE